MCAKSKPAAHDGLLSARALFVIRFFTAAAFAVSAYLAWASLRGGGVAGCGPESGCDKVLHSRWASWLGVPVSLVALVIYATILAATSRLERKVPAELQRKAWSLLVPCAVMVIGAALWFVGLQMIIVKAFCPYCMAAHGSGLLAAVLLFLNTPFRNPPEKPWQIEKQVFVPPALAKKLCLGAVGGLAVLVAGQVLHQPRAFEVRPIASAPAAPTEQPSTSATQRLASSDSSNIAPVTTQVSQTSVNPPNPPTAILTNASSGGTLQVHGSGVQLKLDEVPLLGLPGAPYVMLSLFDYSCHHCRIMHWHLREAQRALSNQLAIVNLPMPLDPTCNYTVTRTAPDHTNACEYARIGLAVWRADRRQMEPFDDWIFAPDRPPPPAAARQFAAQLVGTNAFERAISDPWVSRQIEQDIRIYATNYYHFGRGSMPQLIIGTNVVVGTFRGPQDLYEILSRTLGLKLPGTPVPQSQ